MLVELTAELLAELEGLEMDNKVIVWPGTPASARAVMNRLFKGFFNRTTSMITTQKSVLSPNRSSSPDCCRLSARATAMFYVLLCKACKAAPSALGLG
jgi:hypothetical protein